MILDTIEDIENKCGEKKKSSSKLMTKYEKTNVIGLRIEQLSFGCGTLLDENTLKSCKSIEDIAEKELKLNLLPFVIQRQICDKKFEYFKLSDMIIHDEI